MPLDLQKSKTPVGIPVKKGDLNIKITIPAKKDQHSVRAVETLELKKMSCLTKIPRIFPKRKLTRISEALKEKSSERLSTTSSDQNKFKEIVVEDLSEVQSLHSSSSSVSISNSEKSGIEQEKETKS